MRSLLVFVFLFGLFSWSSLCSADPILFKSPPWVSSNNYDNTDLYKKGYLDVTWYDGWNGNTVDQNGSQDSTAALNKALEDAAQYSLIAYFPSGTYLVSDTLTIVDDYAAWGSKNANIYGSTKGSGAVIQLAANSQGFSNTDNPKPVIHVWAKSADQPKPIGDPYIAFDDSVRNIDIDIQSGNPGAAGLRFAAAQGSYIENVKVYSSSGSNFFAGFYELPARSMGALNIEVTGGDYGIHYGTQKRGPGPVVTTIGARLINQRRAAVYSPIAWAPNILVGFEIVKETGPAVEIEENPFDQGTIGLVDGSIEITGNDSGPAILNSDGLSIYLQNVFVRGASDLIANRGESVSLQSGWSYVREYSYCDRVKKKIAFYNLIDGDVSQATISDIVSASPPSDIRTKHLISDVPSFEDNDVVDIRDLGATGDDETDDTAIIQNAINNHRKVFIPKGRFLISDTLELRNDTQIFGASLSIARLEATSDWNPTQQTYYMRSPDNADATTYLEGISFFLPMMDLDRDRFGMLDWRSGRNSVVRNVDRWSADWTFDKPTNKEDLIRISGNGGGRFYFPVLMVRASRSASPIFRLLRVDGTSEPLTLYGFNPEHANGDKLWEISNSQNVRIFGLKTETSKGFQISNSDNIFIFGIGGHIGNTREGIVKVLDSNNVKVAHLTHVKPDNRTNSIVENNSDGSKCSISKANAVALYSKGNFDSSVFDYLSPDYPTSIEVISLTLVDADTNEDIYELDSANNVNLLQYPNINIRANTNPPTVGSVVFSVDDSNFSNENQAPYSIAGDSSGDYNAWNLSEGSYLIEAVPFELAGGNGDKGNALSVVINLIESDQQTDSFSATEDAYLENGNLFNSDNLKVQNSASRVRESFLKFSVSGIGGRNVETAQLILTCATDPGNGRLLIYEGSHNDWNESNLDSSTPAEGASVTELTSEYVSGKEYSFDVSSLVSGDGDYTFIVVQELGGNDVSFGSLEGGNGPELIIVSR